MFIYDNIFSYNAYDRCVSDKTNYLITYQFIIITLILVTRYLGIYNHLDSLYKTKYLICFFYLLL